MDSVFLDKLVAARCHQQQIQDLCQQDLPTTLAQAYDLQEQLHLRLQDREKGQIVGHKIGCTTAVMQRYLEVDHPCAGGVFSTTVGQERLEIPLDQFRRAGVECEIAVTLGRDLPWAEQPWQANQLAPYIDSACAAIELVDDRFDDYNRHGVRAMVADDFFNAGIVLGRPVRFGPQLTLCSLAGKMDVDGKEAGQGTGQEILGDPLTALAWLANHRQERQQSLKAGEFITLGSVVKTQWIEKSQTTVRVAFEQLGTAEVQFL